MFFGDAKSPEQLKLASLAGMHGELSNESQIYQLHGDGVPCEAGGGNMDWVREGAHELAGSEVVRMEMDGEESSSGVKKSIPHVVSP